MRAKPSPPRAPWELGAHPRLTPIAGGGLQGLAGCWCWQGWGLHGGLSGQPRVSSPSPVPESSVQSIPLPAQTPALPSTPH